MRTARAWVIGLGVISQVAASPAEPVELREVVGAGSAVQTTVTLKAEGQVRPDLPGEKTPSGRKSEPLPMRVETRLEFAERPLQAGSGGHPERSARWVNHAEGSIRVGDQTWKSQLRPEVRLLVAERRPEGTLLLSPGGPLERSELELVANPGDPLALADLLPSKPVQVGATWTVGPAAARSLGGYEALAANALEATLKDCGEARATIRLAGTIRGATLGAEGTVTASGTLVFDRKAGRIERLTLDRSESRKAGPVETALEVKSTLTVERASVDPPPQLSDTVLAGLPRESEPSWELLRFTDPGGKYTLLHDRDWHLYWNDARQAVLKRLDHGEMVAQCNLMAGPGAGPGHHEDLGTFRSGIRQALGTRFGKFLEMGDVEGAAADELRYRVVVQGSAGQGDVLWIYYLLASPAGDQVVATFTLWEAQAKSFGDQDLKILGSLRWTRPEGAR